MKDKENNSCGRGKYALTQYYKSYADHAFLNSETCHPHCENAEDSLIFTPTNDECQYPNWKYVLQKCTTCTYIALPGVKRYSLNRSPMIMFNTCMTQLLVHIIASK